MWCTRQFCSLSIFFDGVQCSVVSLSVGAQGLTLMISWTSLMVKVKSQGHRVKNVISMVFFIWNPGLWCDIMTSYDIMVWCHEITLHHGKMSQYYVMSWNDNSQWVDGSAATKHFQFLQMSCSWNFHQESHIISIVIHLLNQRNERTAKAHPSWMVNPDFHPMCQVG